MSLNLQGYQYKKYNHFRYEIKTEIWFGPLKKATAALLDAPENCVSHIEYLDYLEKNEPAILSNLEGISFYTFEPRKRYTKRLPPGFNYHIAVTYLKPNPVIRKEIFESRTEITKKTGWYPLSMGSKALTSVPLDYFDKKSGKVNAIKISSIDIGEIRKVIDVAGDAGGNSFVLRGTTGSILFDSGFDLYVDQLEDIKAICLSHFHKDHSNGLESAIYETDAPIFTSEPTFRYLWEKSERDPSLRKKYLKRISCIESLEDGLESKSGLGTFPVFHAPGAYGFYFTDKKGRCLIYPGDLCIKNGFYDSKDSIIRTIQGIKANEKWVFIDGSMVGKNYYSIDSEDTPRNIITGLTSSINKRTIAFVSQSPETLIYSFVLAFIISNNSKSNDATSLIVNRDLQRLSQSLLGPMLVHDYEKLDPFVYSVLGKATKNFAESHRVYPVSALSYFDTAQKLLLFITPSDIAASNDVKKYLHNADIVLAGKLALDDEIPQSVLATRYRSILRISSPDWNFHSTEEDLVILIKQLTANKTHTILFHNNLNILNDFIVRSKLDQLFVHAMNSGGIDLI